jgi:hypothetical protein
MRSFVPDGDGQVRLSDVEEVSPAAAEAVIEVEAFSVNRGETLLLENPPDGWRPGKDIADAPGRYDVVMEHAPDVIDAIRQRRLRGNAVLTLN